MKATRNITIITYLLWLDLSCSEIFNTIHEAVFCQFIIGSQEFFELQNTKIANKRD